MQQNFDLNSFLFSIFIETVPESPRFFFKEIQETTIKIEKVIPLECDRIELTISKYALAGPEKG